MPKVLKWIGIVLVGLVLLSFVSQLVFDGPDSDAPTFSEFLDRLEAGDVASVTLVPSHEEIEVEPSRGAESSDEYEVAYPADYTAPVVDKLRDEGVPIEVNANPGWAANFFYYLGPLAVFVAFWVWLARRLRDLTDRIGTGGDGRDS